MSVDMISVVSSNIAAIGYDKENQNVHVQFIAGSEYIYKGVPEHEFQTFLHAQSLGSHLHRNFKNVYAYERIS